jgi:hypothetical protein
MSRDEQRAIVELSTILRGTVGSTVHGLHHGGQDDRDEMAISSSRPVRARPAAGALRAHVEPIRALRRADAA